jgi:hypothetical protein
MYEGIYALRPRYDTSMESTHPSSIYHLVASGFGELGASDPSAFTHCILLQDRFFLGHRFECEGFEAICHTGEGVLEFRNQEGVLLKTVSPHGKARRKAA